MPVYASTRGGAPSIRAAEAILTGIAPDGGLYVPEELVPFTLGEIEAMRDISYAEISARVLSKFLSDWDEAEILGLTREAYSAFPRGDAAPLRPIRSRLWAMELYHGPTLAFKDVALQLLPRLMAKSALMTGGAEERLILTATSGDTGKAALSGFCDVPGTRVCVFYPEGGTSEAQRLQMVTQRGGNMHVIAVKGDFDDAQTGVKRLFADKELRERLAAKGICLSSANSINLGRLAPQVAYYFRAYVRLLSTGALRMGEPLVFCVPSGNFGDILAGYYAMRLGLPVGRLICASNSNNVLHDFFRTGVYDAGRPLLKTASPSMDILVSSNLERLLYAVTNGDAARVASWMRDLRSDERRFEVGEEIRARLSAIFSGYWADEGETASAIERAYREYGYLCDPHTAVGLDCYEAYARDTGDGRPAVLVSTASPFKFASSVLGALDPGAASRLDDFECADALAERTGQTVPAAIGELKRLPVLHTAVCSPEDMKAALCRELFG